MSRRGTRLAAGIIAVLLSGPSIGVGQGLPQVAPMNPMGASRSGIYFQPFLDPDPGRWVADFGLEYASVIEYNQLPPADYVLDSELLRINFGLRRDLGTRGLLTLGAGLGGAYAGFLDGFLDWYHGTLGLEVTERERRPRDRFLYSMTLPDGANVSRFRSNLYLEDVRVGLGLRHDSRFQSAVSVTLPTSTGPEGFGRGVPSLALVNTLRTPLDKRFIYEGSVGLGYTPSHGSLPEGQRELFLSATSGLRYRIWGRQSLYANLFYHSAYYRNTTLPALDRRDLSLDFGWILTVRNGREWRVGLTEDLEPGGPGVDVVLRLSHGF